MISYVPAISVIFALLFLPEKRAAFAPWKLRHPPTSPSRSSSFVANLDDWTPKGDDDDRQEYYEYNEQWQQPPFSPEQAENGSMNQSYRADSYSDTPPANSLPQQGFHKQAPYDSRPMNNNIEPYSDPRTRQVPVNSRTMNNNRAAYRERPCGVSAAHNSKGPPMGAFAPPSMRAAPGAYRSAPSAHNGRDVTPWNSQRRIDHSFADNLAQRSPTLGDASMSTRYRHQQPAGEPEAPYYNDEYLDQYEYPPQQRMEDIRYQDEYDPQRMEDIRYQDDYIVDIPVEPATPVTASYVGPNANGSKIMKSNQPAAPVMNRDPNQMNNGMPRPDDRNMPAAQSFDDTTKNIPTAKVATVRRQDIVPNGMGRPDERTAPTAQPFDDTGVKNIPTTNGATVKRHVVPKMPNDVTVSNVSSRPVGFPSPPIVNGASRAQSNDSLASKLPIANGVSNADGASNPPPVQATQGMESFAERMNGAPSNAGVPSSPQNDSASRTSPQQGSRSSTDNSNSGPSQPNVPSAERQASVGNIPDQVDSQGMSNVVNGATGVSKPMERMNAPNSGVSAYLSAVAEAVSKSSSPKSPSDPMTKEEILAARSDEAVAVAMNAYRNNMAVSKKEDRSSSSGTDNLKVSVPSTNSASDVKGDKVRDIETTPVPTNSVSGTKHEVSIGEVATLKTDDAKRKRIENNSDISVQVNAMSSAADVSRSGDESTSSSVDSRVGKDDAVRNKEASQEARLILDKLGASGKSISPEPKENPVPRSEPARSTRQSSRETATGKSKAKKDSGATHNPLSSFFNQFSGTAKKKISSKKVEKRFKPKPPKSPPPDYEKAVSSRSASVSTDTEPSKMPEEEDTAEKSDRVRHYAFDELVKNDELTLEERIAASIAEAKESSSSKITFDSTKENLEEFKSRTQERLDRSASKREKAAEMVAEIKARMEAEARAIEEQLAEELAETQAEIHEEATQVLGLLKNELQLEVEREENMDQLMDSLQQFIDAKEYDIAKEKNITKEVMSVRSKMKDGTIADNLDNLVEQKLSAVLVEQELVNDLFEFLNDLQDLLDDSRDRASRIRHTLDEFSEPDTESSTPYEWKDIEEMELVLEKAAENVKHAEERIRDVSQRIDNAFVSRAVVLGEDVPPGLAKTAQRAASRSVKRASDFPDVDLDLDVENFMDLKNKDEKELLGMLAKSVTSATYDSSRAAAYGIKAIVDTVTGKPGAKAARQIAKIKKEQEGVQDTNTIVEYNEGNKNKVVETVKSTASALGSVGKAGSTVVKGIGETDSAQVAGEALKETKKDLFSTLETAAALGIKLYSTTVNRIEERKEKGGEEDLP